MWAIRELIPNYALKHTYQLRSICELTSETYFHVALVALAEQLLVFKSSSILLEPPLPPPKKRPPHLLGNSPPPSPGIFVALCGGGVDNSGTTHYTCALEWNAEKVYCRKREYNYFFFFL